MSHFHHSGKRKRIRGVTPVLQERARELRKRMTPAEQALWEALRAKRIGVRFRRQHAVGHVILDFYCPSHKLVIEVDGAIHEEHYEEDQARTEHLLSYSYKVIRFSNDQVLKKMPQVLKRIREELRKLEGTMP